MASPPIHSSVLYTPNSGRVNLISQMRTLRLPGVQEAAQACSAPVKGASAMDHTHVLPISSSHPRWEKTLEIGQYTGFKYACAQKQEAVLCHFTLHTRPGGANHGCLQVLVSDQLWLLSLKLLTKVPQLACWKVISTHP